MRKRILFFISDTGGGHRAAAKAIEEAINHLYPEQYDIIIEDIWKKYTPWPINRLPNTYAWLTGPGLLVWKLLYTISSRLQAHKFVFPIANQVLKYQLVRYLQTIQPDVIISVHPLLNHLGWRWLQAANLTIPFVTVVTDMVSVHPTWICPEVSLCLVPTQSAKDMALKLGMLPEKVIVSGQPVGLRFASPPGDKKTLRQELGLDAERRTILVLGGGEGIGKVFEIARSIAEQVSQAQMIIVAGRNKTLKQKLDRVTWEIPTLVCGFVNNMPDLMRASDIVITKAGPGTLSEAFIAGLPLIISGYIPGQETGNVAYVEEHQAGVYTESPQEITRLVAEWMDPNNQTLKRLSHQAASLGRPDASLKIATAVCDLI